MNNFLLPRVDSKKFADFTLSLAPTSSCYYKTPRRSGQPERMYTKGDYQSGTA